MNADGSDQRPEASDERGSFTSADGRVRILEENGTLVGALPSAWTTTMFERSTA